MILATLARRRFLALSAGVGSLLVAPEMVAATVPTHRRFVFIIQRGAADGLNIVVPYGDPNYAKLRGGLAIDPSAAIKLDDHFALHPALTQVGNMFRQGQALFFHAVASTYRDRSHFDGQNVLETGGVSPFVLRTGWINRLVSLLPNSAEQALAFAETVPPALRGPAPVMSYFPSNLPQPIDDLLERVGRLYGRDPQLHSLWSRVLDTKAIADRAKVGKDPISLGRLAASFLVKPLGPRIAMLETGGWDTHSAQSGRLAANLRGLDALLASLRDGLGSVWASTTVLIATEFGRTAATNGTGGTDHGTGSAAMLVGGAIKGGRVVADWPGLGAAQLYEGRDLMPTTALEAVIAGTVSESFGLDPDLVVQRLFPDKHVDPQTGLVT